MRSNATRAVMALVGATTMVFGCTAVTASVKAGSGEGVEALAKAVQRMRAGDTPSAAIVSASARMHAFTPTHTANATNGQVSAQSVDDPDGDGAANEPHDADINDNGVPDDQDPTIAFFQTDDGWVALGIYNATSEQLRNVSHDAVTRAAGNVNLPYGLLGYDVINVTHPVDMILIWEDNGSGATDLFKGTASGVAQYPVVSSNSQDGLLGWGYVLSDGGAGDADHTANGTITDPIGPGIATAGAVTTTTTVGSTSTTTPGDTTTSTTVGSTTTSTSVAPTSTTTSTTIATAPGDPDGDGVADEPHGYDVNDNGVADDQDPTVALMTTPVGRVALAILHGAGQFRDVAFDDVSAVGNIATPYGLLNLKVINAAGPVEIGVVWARNDAPVTALYKGKGNALAVYPIVQDESDDNVIAVSYNVRDGAEGDQDGKSNGVIVDPVGPGYEQAAPVTTAAAISGASSNTQTSVLGATLARTGRNATVPAVGGVLLLVLGALLMGVAAKPKGLHFL